jgi:hypothetical protein
MIVIFENLLLLAENLPAQGEAAGFLGLAAGRFDAVFAGRKEERKRQRFIEKRHVRPRNC